jgi:6-phosphogluconolactonase
MNTAEFEPEIRVVPDLAAVWDESARRFADAARAAVAARGRFTVALSGGSTPEGLYRELATRQRAAGSGRDAGRALDVPWQQTHIFFGDERYVPHDDPQSNFRMAREALLDHVPIPAQQVHAMPTDAADANLAAAEYEQTLAAVFQTPLPVRAGLGEGQERVPGTQCAVPTNPFPRFDLLLLGMGPDGHTASLFPGTDAIHETRRWVMAPWVAKFNTFRLTLTPPVINQARQVLFLVSGASKAETLRDVLEGPYDPSRLPSQIVRPVDGQLTWLVDREAAAKLSKV